MTDIMRARDPRSRVCDQKNSIPCGQSAHQRADGEITNFRIKFGSADTTPDSMHSATPRRLGGWTMVTEVVRIAHSVRGVAELCSAHVQVASNETPFDQKSSSFWIDLPSPMLCIHPTQPKHTSRDKKLSAPLSYGMVHIKTPQFSLRALPSAKRAPPGLRASPCIEYCTGHDAHELYGSSGAVGACGWVARLPPRSDKGPF